MGHVMRRDSIEGRMVQWGQGKGPGSGFLDGAGLGGCVSTGD